MSEEVFESNSEAIEAWNTVLFDKFVRFRKIVTMGFGRHGTVAMERYPPPLHGRVLDVGCGFGDTTLELASKVGVEGEAVGIDAAERFIEEARSDASEAQVKNVRFLVADVERDELGGPFDQVFSRFGTMFFANPVPALRNMRRSLRPGGQLVMVVWRTKMDNAFIYEAEQCVLKIVPQPDKKPDQVTCGPGPFSMASADLVSTQLLAAGFERVRLERFDVDICIGDDLDDTIQFAMALGPAGEILRLAGPDAEQYRPAVVSGLRDQLRAHLRTDGVYAGSSSWIVTALA